VRATREKNPTWRRRGGTKSGRLQGNCSLHGGASVEASAQTIKNLDVRSSDHARDANYAMAAKVIERRMPFVFFFFWGGLFFFFFFGGFVFGFFFWSAQGDGSKHPKRADERTRA